MCTPRFFANVPRIATNRKRTMAGEKGINTGIVFNGARPTYGSADFPIT
jgi:hypothetical protein